MPLFDSFCDMYPACLPLRNQAALNLKYWKGNQGNPARPIIRLKSRSAKFLGSLWSRAAVPDSLRLFSSFGRSSLGGSFRKRGSAGSVPALVTLDRRFEAGSSQQGNTRMSFDLERALQEGDGKDSGLGSDWSPKREVTKRDPRRHSCDV